ncbi:hypothetical protein Tco_1304272 [Tanacetum coccineum]
MEEADSFLALGKMIQLHLKLMPTYKDPEGDILDSRSNIGETVNHHPRPSQIMNNIMLEELHHILSTHFGRVTVQSCLHRLPKDLKDEEKAALTEFHSPHKDGGKPKIHDVIKRGLIKLLTLGNWIYPNSDSPWSEPVRDLRLIEQKVEVIAKLPHPTSVKVVVRRVVLGARRFLPTIHSGLLENCPSYDSFCSEKELHCLFLKSASDSFKSLKRKADLRLPILLAPCRLGLAFCELIVAMLSDFALGQVLGQR